MITSYGWGVCCVVDVSEAEVELVVEIPAMLPTGQRNKGGRPILETVLIHGPDSASTIGAESSSHMEMDIEHMMDFPIVEPTLPDTTGVSKPRVCPVCGEEICSGLALNH